MAKGLKTGGRDIKKGQVLNPKGGGAVSPQTRAIRKITLDHIEEVAQVILDGNVQGLKDLSSNPEASVLKVWIARAASEGIKRGDMHPLDLILNRILGKPKERHEHTGKDGERLKFGDSEAAARLIAILGSVKKPNDT